MQRLDLGAVWRDTVAVVRRHFSVFATLAAAFVFVPSVAMGFVFPQLNMVRMPDPAHPQVLPPGFWPVSLAVGLVTAIGWFSIAAITADPAEGGGRPIGATIAGVVPKIGKAIVAALWLLLAYLAVIIVIIILAVVVGLATGHGGARTGPGGSPPLWIGFAIAAVLLPVIVWLQARLTPLLGVLLREPVSAYAAIKRAWALSRGSAWRIVVILLATIFVSLALQLVLYGIAAALGTSAAAMPFVLVRSALGAWLTIYFAAGAGIVYRHLAGA